MPGILVNRVTRNTQNVKDISLDYTRQTPIAVQFTRVFSNILLKWPSLGIFTYVETVLTAPGIWNDILDHRRLRETLEAWHGIHFKNDDDFCYLQQSHISRLFSTSSDEKLLLQSIGFAFISGLSRCFWILRNLVALQGNQWCFSRLFLVPRPGPQAGSSRLDGLSMLVFLPFSNFPF